MKKILALLFLAQLGLAQEQSEKAHRYLGIGYKLGVFQTSDFYSNFSPVNRLVVNVDPIKYLRIDVQYGFSNSSNEQYMNTGTGTQQKLTLESKNSVLQFGAYGTYEFDDMLMYLGVRYGFGNASSDQISFSGTMFITETNTEKSSILSPVLGAEYRFGNRFSVGAEISYLIVNSEFDPASINSQNTNSSLKLLESSAFFRFFPF
ncbi:MAG: outer membrane beta-barrel protein [Bacteroidia bacterium]|jgi:hypothetical protein|nr:outer membrane beta-barrel protein [Bacteroidia bacterium]